MSPGLRSGDLGFSAMSRRHAGKMVPPCRTGLGCDRAPPGYEDLQRYRHGLALMSSHAPPGRVSITVRPYRTVLVLHRVLPGCANWPPRLGDLARGPALG